MLKPWLYLNLEVNQVKRVNVVINSDRSPCVTLGDLERTGARKFSPTDRDRPNVKV